MSAPQSLRIASWNVNSVRLRVEGIAELARTAQPDVLCLQETKVTNEKFPGDALEAMGYTHQWLHGQPGYHGVAILSKVPFEQPRRLDWCGKHDCRHVAALLPGGIELHNVYVPAGGDEPDPAVNPKFAHKLDFLRELTDWFSGDRQSGRRALLVGDLNIAPLETDVWSHKQLLKVVSHTPIEVAALARLQDSQGWIDAVRHFVPPEEKLYSWWSYRARDWSASDKGRRLDHAWITPALSSQLVAATILRAARGWPVTGSGSSRKKTHIYNRCAALLFDFTKGIAPADSAQKKTMQQHIPSNYNLYTTNNLLHLKATCNKLATKHILY
ncbi:MAG: exodeoxyribonuclease III [Pseudomonadota bacterium]